MKGSKRRTKAFSLGHTIIFQLHEMVYALLQYHGERIQVYITLWWVYLTLKDGNFHEIACSLIQGVC